MTAVCKRRRDPGRRGPRARGGRGRSTPGTKLARSRRKLEEAREGPPLAPSEGAEELRGDELLFTSLGVGHFVRAAAGN